MLIVFVMSLSPVSAWRLQEFDLLPAWDSVVVTVQPGCTNLWLGALLLSRTKADDEGRIGCSQARAKTEYKWGMGRVAHALIIGEHKANVNSRLRAAQ